MKSEMKPATSLKLSDFTAQHIPGLYSYDHFQHESGAFIQVSARRDHFVFQDAEGNRYEFPTFAALKAAVEG